MIRKKNILVDMSCSILHYGHIRLLKKASKLGNVIVALTSDNEIKKHKHFNPELKFKHRKELIESIRYVKKAIKSKFHINENFLKKNKIHFLVHGNDNSNKIKKSHLKIFPRTKNISSTILRKKILKNYLKNEKRYK